MKRGREAILCLELARRKCKKLLSPFRRKMPSPNSIYTESFFCTSRWYIRKPSFLTFLLQAAISIK
jgi:hypothetical protein